MAEAPREGRAAARRPGPPRRAAAALDEYVEAVGLEEPKVALFQSVDPSGAPADGPGAAAADPGCLREGARSYAKRVPTQRCGPRSVTE